MLTQREHELRAYQAGIDRAEAILARNEERGSADSNPYTSPVYRRFVLPLAELIDDARETLGRPGKNGAHVRLIQHLDSDVVALLAVRNVIQLLMQGNDNVRNITAAIGRSVYHEFLLTHFEGINPELFYTLTRDMGRRRSKSEWYKMAVMRRKGEQAGVEFVEWSQSDREHVGAWLVDRLLLLGMVDIRTDTGTRGSQVRSAQVLSFSEEVAKLVFDLRSRAITMMPVFQPLVEPPVPWTAVNEGGFHTEEMRRQMPWCVRISPSTRHHYRNADLSTVLAAINKLQSVSWRINRKLLAAVRQVSQHFDMDEVLAQAEQPKPPKPDWLLDTTDKADMSDEQLAEFVAWKRDMRNWYTEAKLRTTRMGRFATAMRVATELEEYPALWFVYFADFRGRLYAQTTGVSPQGSDLQKALLEFSEGKRLTTRGAVDWFKITGANRWGADRGTDFAGRIHWVHEHHSLILRFAEDPISYNEWQEADKPLQFLAWCFEYAAWVADPANFESRIAVGMDGSCNGLQHFSAMLRDERGGRATNLVPQPLPQDIYQAVADVTKQLLEAAEDDPNGYRRLWLQHGLNRSLVKRSVMTLPYGSTRFACADFIKKDYLDEGKAVEFAKEERGPAAQYLSHFVWAAIGKVVVKATEAMDWLQASSTKLIHAGLDEVSWTTPSGFPVYQTYWKKDEVRIRVKLCGTTQFRLSTENDHPDSRKHRNGIAPNFVHSHDAAHMTLVINEADRQGLTHLAMIHDDYGCHAADAEKLYRITRSVFVEMYEQHDPLQAFQQAYPLLDSPPEKGGLLIRDVLRSEYFFA